MALQQLRVLFVAFTTGIVLIGLVVLVIDGGADDPADPPTAALSAAVLVAGVWSLFLPRLLDRGLDCSTDEALVMSYRTRFFVHLAIAESVALVGFAGFLLTGQPWLYPLGAAFTAVGFLRAAPTDRNLAALQEALALQGCSRSLTAALQA